MTLFADFARLGRQLEATPGRLDKRRLVADFLQAVDTSELPSAVAFLTGHPFPTSDPRVLGVRGLPRGLPARGGPPLTLGDVSAAFTAVAEATGSGSRGARQARLAEMGARAGEEEREFLDRIIGGELRTGVSDGLVLEAIGKPSGLPPPPT